MTDRYSLDEINSQKSMAEPNEISFLHQSLQLCFCTGGLLFSYLIWGLLQERVMVYTYQESENEPSERFGNSQFVVFMNRILAFVIAGIGILLQRKASHKAPLYKYSYSSFSNIMSSWCQYEALKFVSFPVQVMHVKSFSYLFKQLVSCHDDNHAINLYRRIAYDMRTVRKQPEKC